MMEKLYYLSHFLWQKRIPLLPRLLMLVIRAVYCSFIPYQTHIGKGISFGHKLNIVVSRTARIGKNCTIRHGVTIGAGSAYIGDRVSIGAGAKILGNVTIGDDVAIGANSVVIKDVPPSVTVVGVPAKIVRHRGERPSEVPHLV